MRIETDRLVLRRWSKADVEGLAQLFAHHVLSVGETMFPPRAPFFSVAHG
jgi:hypothetical protein